MIHTIRLIPFALAGFQMFVPGQAQAPSASDDQLKTWTGKLVDAKCKAPDATKSCEINADTKGGATLCGLLVIQCC